MLKPTKAIHFSPAPATHRETNMTSQDLVPLNNSSQLLNKANSQSRNQHIFPTIASGSELGGGSGLTMQPSALELNFQKDIANLQINTNEALSPQQSFGVMNAKLKGLKPIVGKAKPTIEQKSALQSMIRSLSP